ncbi:hypothetical protein CRUP_019794 [Coryphaenoides rupestris]|nr:hypothetical protein CRUP_019794 [Coryphaenoides rupestris]
MRRSFSTSTAIATQKDIGRRSPASRGRADPQRRRHSTLSSNGSGSVGGRGRTSPGPAHGPGQARLRVGAQVLLSSANEMALVRYVGAADFAAGVWLGLELRLP